MNPNVSIIIPTYNSSKYITKAIESALAQTDQSIEVIIVDDASTDNTVELIKNFTDDRLKLLVNEHNKGPSYSRNRALKEAKGEWVALLDSDDWYAPKRLKTLLQVAHTENADIIADDLYFIEESAKSPWGRFFAKEGFCFDKPRQIDPVHFVDFNLSLTKPIIKLNFLIQHSLEFNETLRYEEDFELLLLCLFNGARFIIVPEPYYFYCTRPGSLMSEYPEFYEQAYKTNLYFLQQEFTKKNPKLVHSLSRRFLRVKRTRVFYKVRRLIKEGAFLTALTEAVRNPIFFWSIWLRIPVFIKYRISHYRASITQIFVNQEPTR